MFSLLSKISDFLWSYPILFALLGTHIYMTVKLHFPQKLTIKAIRTSLESEDNISSKKGLSGFASLATTLAATLGTGNIVGVSTAVALGGPGAIFWCWITGVLGMATAYAESYLSILYQKRNSDGSPVGGPMYVLEYGLGKKRMAHFYALCVLISAFGIGCATQSSSIAETCAATWSSNKYVVGFLAALATGLVIIGGIKSIGSLCTKLVPIIGAFYICGCLAIMFLYRAALFTAITAILKCAFLPHAAISGVAAGTLQTAIRYGVARGLFTNEAGLGTAAICSASSKIKDPKKQGLIQMTAVFWDTVVMCAITGIVIMIGLVVSPIDISQTSSGTLTSHAFSLLPLFGDDFLAISLAAFAFATLIGWSYFGEKACEYLFGSKNIIYYRMFYIFMIYIGAILPMQLVWTCTDLINAVMVVPSLYALWKLRNKIGIPGL